MTITKRFCNIAFLAVLIAIVSPRVGAFDFTFNVPLQIQNLDEAFTSIGVECEVWVGTTMGRTSAGRVRTNMMPIDGNTGALPVTEKVIPINVITGTDPRDVTSYTCDLYVSKRGASGVPVRVDNATQTFSVYYDGQGRSVKIGDPTQPFRSRVSGAIPRP